MVSETIINPLHCCRNVEFQVYLYSDCFCFTVYRYFQYFRFSFNILAWASGPFFSDTYSNRVCDSTDELLYAGIQLQQGVSGYDIHHL